MQQIFNQDIISNLLNHFNFLQLGKLSLVSKSDIGLYWSLLPELTLASQPFSSTIVRHAGERLKSVTLLWWNANTAVIIPTLSERCPNLTSLSIHPHFLLNDPTTHTHLPRILQRLSSLTISSPSRVGVHESIIPLLNDLFQKCDGPLQLKVLSFNFGPRDNAAIDALKALLDRVAPTLTFLSCSLPPDAQLLGKLLSKCICLEKVQGIMPPSNLEQNAGFVFTAECLRLLPNSDKLVFDMGIEYNLDTPILLDWLFLWSRYSLSVLVTQFEAAGIRTPLQPRHVAYLLTGIKHYESETPLIVSACSYLSTSKSRLLPSPDEIRDHLPDYFFESIAEKLRGAHFATVVKCFNWKPQHPSRIVAVWLHRNQYESEYVEIFDQLGSASCDVLLEHVSTLIPSVQTLEALQWLLNKVVPQEIYQFFVGKHGRIVALNWIKSGKSSLLSAVANHLKDESILAFTDPEYLFKSIASDKYYPDPSFVERILNATGLANISAATRGALLTRFLGLSYDYQICQDVYYFLSNLFYADLKAGSGLEPLFFTDFSDSVGVWFSRDLSSHRNRKSRNFIEFLRRFKEALLRQLDEKDQDLEQFFDHLVVFRVEISEALRGEFATENTANFSAEDENFVLNEIIAPFARLCPRSCISSCARLIFALSVHASRLDSDEVQEMLRLCAAADFDPELPEEDHCVMSAAISEAIFFALLPLLQYSGSLLLEKCVELVQDSHLNELHNVDYPFPYLNLMDHLCLSNVAPHLRDTWSLFLNLARRGARMSVTDPSQRATPWMEGSYFHATAIETYDQVLRSLSTIE